MTENNDKQEKTLPEILSSINSSEKTGMVNSKKRKTISLEIKEKIINASKHGASKAEIARKFKCSRPAVVAILQQEEAILQAIDDGISGRRFRLKTGKFEELESTLLDWFKEVRASNINVVGTLLAEKALEIAEKLGIQDFKASAGFIENFKKRHSIVFRGLQGEAAGIDVGSVVQWQEEVLRHRLKEYAPRDIFNADETGLFWKLFPDKTLAFKGEICTSGKKSKERLTVLVGANMAGTEKLPLLVIGKSAHPRCFKNQRIPLEYASNKKAWMTSEKFEAWMKKWDRTLTQQGRKVLLVIDNCTAHPRTPNLHSIKLLFLPPNTTAASQPMDQGIIQNLKIHYRRHLLRRYIAAIEDGGAVEFTLLDALHLLQRAWGEVREDTIRNCFRKAGFVENLEQAAEEETILPEFDDIEQLWQIASKREGIELAVYINIDEQTATSGTRTLDELIEEHSRDETLNSDSKEAATEKGVPIAEEIIISNKEATEACRILRKYFIQRQNSTEAVNLCNKLEDYIIDEKITKMVQKKITEYFNK